MSIAVFARSLHDGTGIVQTVRDLPWWVWPVVGLLVVQPMVQMCSWTRAAAASRGRIRWKGRVVLLLLFEIAKYWLLYNLGVAWGGEVGRQARMNAYVEFMMSAAANGLSYLTVIYCSSALRIPILEQIASVAERLGTRLAVRHRVDVHG